MIGGPQPSGGMEGLKSQLKQGNAEGSAGGPNGVPDATDQPNEVDDDKGNSCISNSKVNEILVYVILEYYLFDQCILKRHFLFHGPFKR